MPRTILLADDSVTAQNMGKKILSDAGFEVITVSNGSAALKKAIELIPDIAVLDVYMPGYSGLEVCKQLKENAKTADIPVLLTVGKLEPFKSEEALKARANAFIIKPFEATELLAVINKIEAANAKPAKKPVKAPKASALSKVFAPSASTSASVEEPAADPGMQDAKIEEKGWKNRLTMPGKKKTESDLEPGEEDTSAIGTGFRDLMSPPAEDDGTRRDSSYTAASTADAALDISPEEIAAIKAAVEILSGEGDRAPVLQVGAVDGMPRQLAPEPEEVAEEIPREAAKEAVATEATPDTTVEVKAVQESIRQESIREENVVQNTSEVVSTSVPSSAAEEPAVAAVSGPEFESAPVPKYESASSAAKSHWVAEAVELTPAEVSLALEREMQDALGLARTGTQAPGATTTEVQTEKFDTYSLADFAESTVAAPVDDEPIVAEAEAAKASAMAASAAGDSNAVSNRVVTAGEGSGATNVGTNVGTNVASGFVDLRPMASAAGAAPGLSEVAGEAIPARDPSAPEDEIDSRTKSQMDAAWSNWREIRNTIVRPNLTEQLADIAASVAAGPEATASTNGAASLSPDGVGHDPAAIANIVDSVLAEMRPKLLEEITRKLAAKKND